MNLQKIAIIEKTLNKKLARLFQEQGIKNFTLISLGNSIASGYSMVRTTKPLLLRNDSLPYIMKESGIDTNIHHFARAQNNNDEHIYSWITNNVKESEIHRLNRSDYSNEATSLPTNNITDKEMDLYYPIDIPDDVRLHDLIIKNDVNLANIIIYNGATGSFLDGITRQGSIGMQLMYGVKRDITSIEASLKLIQNSNRTNNSNTQVYLCGAPDFLGLKVSELINHKLKKLAKNYDNVVYVPPVRSKFIYNKVDEKGSDLRKKAFDIHYDEEEYKEFNNNIISAINDNYLITSSLINVDRKFYHLSGEIETINKDLVSTPQEREEIVLQIISSELKKFKEKKEMMRFLKRLNFYVKARFPYDFYYLGKKEVIDAINNSKKTK